MEFTTNITHSFFGVSYFQNNEILLIASKDNPDDEYKSYVLKIGSEDDDTPDEINERVISYNEVRVFKDKLFYPLFDEVSVNLPLIIGDNIEALSLESNSGNIICQKCNDINSYN